VFFYSRYKFKDLISKKCECVSKVDVAKCNSCPYTVCAHSDCVLQPGIVVTSMLHTVVDNFGVGEEGYQRSCSVLNDNPS
jgi:hypothetical protein